MGILSLAIVRVIISLSTLLTVAALHDLGYSIEKYDDSPGISYENRGTAVLYNLAWRTVVYVKLNKIDNETLVLRRYAHHVDALRQMTVIKNWTGCAHFGSDNREHLMKEDMNEVTKYMNVLTAETNEETSLFRAIIEVEGHILRVNHVMRTVQRNLDLLIDSVIHAQKGVLRTTSNSLPSDPNGSLNKKCLRLPKRYHRTYPHEQGLSAPISQTV